MSNINDNKGGSNYNKKNRGDDPDFGFTPERTLFEGTISELNGNGVQGHNGKLIDGDGKEHNFVTQGGFLVSMDQKVMAYSEVQNTGEANNPGNERKNTTHGGPKAIVISEADPNPIKP